MHKTSNFFIYGYQSKTSGKWYIGQTKQPIKNRAGTNGCRYTNKELGHCKIPKFGSAILSYGWDDFELTIFNEGKMTQEEADNYEKSWIQEKDSIKNWYNMSPGGQSGHEMTDEIKEKLSIRVKCIETGIIYESITTAAKETGTNRTILSAAVNKKSKNCWRLSLEIYSGEKR